MSEGLSIEGDKIFYDGQQVGIITITEGTSLHAKVVEAISAEAPSEDEIMYDRITELVGEYV